ncbi:IclR family KDG regulon transcriptional repressor [Ohessyouella blattaphilus]|uniref:IclR family transcriptional regulator n=1 Tax=Ohessyouella blattaphilus TaxID=2949333 RepID=A0ABT1EEB8_9FIRM|nr:IclR family transcriptional regulator [Ohessyouella blattaphilus]MCP1108988.1 IclR family transcriptional regulator [Ohessyouella blattaphilus]MCR8562382.1 IclR family transcriptional regulator [Ohessyouella blattaphilus]
MENGDKNKQYILSSVETALSVLELYFDHEELSAAEVAKYLKISRSTAFRFLVTLESKSYLKKTENSKYRLGIKLFALGQVANRRMELISLVHPYLERLTEFTGETSHFTCMDGDSYVAFLDHVLGTKHLHMNMMLGTRRVAHTTASGKVMLAYGAAQQITKYLKNISFIQQTENSIKDAKQLLEELEEIKEIGYGCDNEEAEVGLSCYAVPLLNAEGMPVAAISISGPTTRLIANKESYLKKLEEAAGEIMSALK